jgi:DNA repair protein RadD
LILRPYQLRARAAARQAYVEGKRAILYVAPTGAGKTVILGDTIASHLRNRDGARVNVFAHRTELLSQAAATFRAFGLDVGVHGENAAAPVQVISTQAALARGEIASCTLGVLDEAHHYAADEWGTVVTALKESGATICGATATPERGDGRGLGHIFDHIVVVAQPKELVASGALVPCDWRGPVRTVPKGKLAQHPLKAHQRFANGRRNVIFAPNLKAAREWMAEFETAGVKSSLVWGTQKADERARALSDFRDGRVEVLFNVYCLTEGWDCPEVGVVTLARPIGSTGALIQMAGRGARPAPGKTHYTLLDLRGACMVHGKPDDDREFSLEELGISSGSGTGITGDRACKMCKKALGDDDICPHCGKDNSQEVPGDAGIALSAWQTTMRRDDDGARVARLAKWIAQARARGQKWQTALYRYRGTYGSNATADIVRRALSG